MRHHRFALILAAFSVLPATLAQADVIYPVEDVMTSSFFTGTDLVRGYPADSRPTFRVSTEDAFGVTGAETIYMTFNPSDFASFTAPVASAVLTVISKSGGFNADASAGSPFTVSAHGVTADPLTSITDDTNPSGPISWLDFHNNNILPADPAALTSINGFGTFTFDVTSLVNSWVEGTNTVFALALTGKNDTSGNDFLHGFTPYNDASSPANAMFLTVAQVPEPTALVLGVLGAAAVLVGRGRRERDGSV